MGITIRDLVEAPHLALSLHSGGDGLDREAVWTHTSDLPDPWHWLSRGDLLLTNGMSFPADEAAQVHLLEELERVGTAGLAVGEEMYCPPLTPGFTEASERLGLPVLWIRYPMPFSAISRLVAEATLLEQSQRLIRTERIYNALRRTASDPSDLNFESALSVELRSEARVYHRKWGLPFYPRHRPDVVDAVRDASQGMQIAGARSVALDGREVLIVDVPTHDELVLVVWVERDVPMDGILLQHAATVVALEVSRVKLRLEHERRSGAEMLSQALGGTFDHERFSRHLRTVGLDPSGTVLAAVASDSIARLRDVHMHLWRTEIPHVVVHRQGVVLALVPDEAKSLEIMARFAGEPAQVGVSAPLGRLSRAVDAYREARWSLGAARRTDTDVVRYREAGGLVGFSEIDDAKALVDRCLIQIIEHDRLHGSGLLETLDSFLIHERSWQKTAEALQVHRQTVRYRIKKVEELSQRRLADTAGIAELWMALRARDLLTGKG